MKTYKNLFSRLKHPFIVRIVRVDGVLARMREGKFAKAKAYLEIAPELVNSHSKDNGFMPLYDSGFTPLHQAVRCGNTDFIEFLLAKGADIEARTKKGLTPLHWAICYQIERDESAADSITVELTQLLLSRGANANAHGGANVGEHDSRARSVLHDAYYKKNVELIQILIEAGADTSQKDSSGYLPGLSLPLLIFSERRLRD